LGKAGRTVVCNIKLALLKTTVCAVLGRIQVMSFFDHENGTLKQISPSKKRFG